jgi:serine/threonine-protein kinase RsbW
MSPPSRSQRVEIVVPLRPEFASVLRVTTASMASDIGFSIDEIDDLRLAINEVFGTMLEPAERNVSDPGGEEVVTCRFDLLGDGLAVEMVGPDGSDLQLDDLASTILGSVVDRFEHHGDRISMSKRAREANGALASPS